MMIGFQNQLRVVSVGFENLFSLLLLILPVLCVFLFCLCVLLGRKNNAAIVFAVETK